MYIYTYDYTANICRLCRMQMNVQDMYMTVLDAFICTQNVRIYKVPAVYSEFSDTLQFGGIYLTPNPNT